MKKTTIPQAPKARGKHRELRDPDSPFHYSRVEQRLEQDRRDTKYRKRPQDYLEDDWDDDWDDSVSS